MEWWNRPTTLYLSIALRAHVHVRAPAPPFPWEGLARETSVHTNVVSRVQLILNSCYFLDTGWTYTVHGRCT